MDARQPVRLAARCLWLLPLTCLGAAGCADGWDEITARDFSFKSYFAAKPDPLVVLRDSTDGNRRAKALAALREPLQTGGTQEQQDVVVKVLVAAAVQDRQPWCRHAAIASLATFKDPRVPDALRDAYYSAASFNPEIATQLRCQTLEALGNVGNPASVDFLVKVLREPPVEGAEQDKQQKTDERISAARALAHFNHYQGTSALVGVLKTEQDVALRESAHASLVAATGRNLPADAKVWDDLLQNTTGEPVVVQPERKLFGIVPVSWK